MEWKITQMKRVEREKDVKEKKKRLAKKCNREKKQGK